MKAAALMLLFGGALLIGGCLAIESAGKPGSLGAPGSLGKAGGFEKAGTSKKASAFEKQNGAKLFAGEVCNLAQIPLKYLIQLYVGAGYPATAFDFKDAKKDRDTKCYIPTWSGYVKNVGPTSMGCINTCDQETCNNCCQIWAANLGHEDTKYAGYYGLIGSAFYPICTCCSLGGADKPKKQDNENYGRGGY